MPSIACGYRRASDQRQHRTTSACRSSPPAATPGALSLAQRSAFMKLTQRRHDDLGFHALTEFSVNLARLHQSVASDDEFGGHRQEVRLIPVIFFKLYAGLFVERLNLAADPEDQS